MTAQKRAENVQSTPMSISALTQENLEAMGINSLDGIALASPSITFTPYPNSSNILILYMRGQGVSDPAQITSDGSVGLYQDGFYISRPQASTFDLADLERVEVLRGPQGTLYGRNTTGGAVNLISKEPTGEFGFRQKLTFGTRNQFRSLTTVDLPAWQDIATKLTLLKSSIDGYVSNPGSGHDFGEEEQLAGRIAMKWNGLEDFSVDYFMEMGSLDSTPGYYQNAAWSGRPITVDGSTNTYHQDAGKPQSRAYRPIDLELSNSDYESHGLTLTWDVSDTLTIKSLTGYRELEWRAYQDFAEAFGFITSTDPNFPLQPLPIFFTSDNAIDDHQFSQEFQFIGDLLDDRISYVAGLYYFEESAASDGFGVQVALGSTNTTDRYVTADAKSMAAFGQLTWTPNVLDENLQLTFGARYTKDEREATRDLINRTNGIVVDATSQLDASNSDTYEKFNPSFTVSYDWSEELNAYLKIATGYKAGGSSESGPVDQFDNTVEPENVTSIEIGVKSYWFDRRLRANIAVFESQFDDMQMAFAVDPTDSSIVQSYNAGEATVRGLEADLALQPMDDLTFSLQYAYLDPELEEIEALAGTVFDPTVNPAAAGVYSVGQNIKDTFSLPYAPRHSVNLAADYSFFQFDGGSLTAHLDYRFQSSIYAASTSGPEVPGRDNLEIPSYGILNGRLSMAMELPRGDRLTLALWGQNLTDKEYPVQVVGLGSAVPTINPLGQVIYGYVQSAKIWAEPASYGVDINYEY